MKLEQKHVAAYSPYDVEARINPAYDNNFGTTDTFPVLGCSTDTSGLVPEGWIETYHKLTGERGNHIEIKTIQLILRPLFFSELTKEQEINGKTFVPILELIRSCHAVGDTKLDFWNPDDLTDTIMVGYAEDHEFNWRISVGPLHSLTYDYAEKLFEWHFNVFDLPEDLWVDVNTLDENSYK